MAYQIFISFKNEWNGKPTRDSEIAQELYDELKKYGVEVFFSNEEVQRKGRPDYGRLIDSALDSSKVLLLVGTRAEFVNSRWVEYEWDLFNNEICSGRKDGKIITVLEGMDIGELPIGMRRWQSYDGRDIANAAEMAINTLEALTGMTYRRSETASSAVLSSNYNSMTAEELNCIGEDYYYGENGKTEDKKEAVRYYRLAADQGYANAQYSLGYCYEFGKGVAKDKKEAVRYYRLAADQGYASAQCNLGFCYRDGTGVKKDKKEAVRYYRLAADQGYARAQCNLGYCYDFGEGVAKDRKEAVRYYRLAADQGYARAQCNLGFCYRDGTGVEKDLEKAKYWFSLAVAQGHEKAKKALSSLS